MSIFASLSPAGCVLPDSLRRFIPVFLFSLCLSPAPLCAEPLTPSPTRFAFTYESLDLAGGEKLGLLGTTLLVEPAPWLATGLGIYSAVAGERGGFFTGGLETTAQTDLVPGLRLSGGLFVGGGGGGAAPQGGGLMLRPHFELTWQSGPVDLTLGVSRIRFPNGEIDSSQIFAGVQLPMEIETAAGWQQAPATAGMAPGSDRNFALTTAVLLPPRAVRQTDGRRTDKPIGLLGAELSGRFAGHYYLKLAAAGAATGEADGFALFGSGGGWETTAANGASLRLGGLIAAAGGGRVDSGGGLLGGLETEVRQPLGGNWLISANGGYLAAVDGDFEAVLLGLRLVYANRDRHSSALNEPAHWRLRGGMQNYAGRANLRKEEGSRDGISLITAKIDHFYAENRYLSVQALAACRGDAGGYAVGLAGPGWRFPLDKDAAVAVEIELLAGTGGGGGIATGGGLLLQPMAGLDWRINSTYGLTVAGGLIAAPDSELLTPIADLSLNYRFTTRAF